MYVLLDCKLSFRCFDGVAVLSANCRCGIKPARSTKNFGMDIVHSGNRRKFTSMFNCASLARPCASVAKEQTKFYVPLTALIMHLKLTTNAATMSNIGKTVFIASSKIYLLELRDFSADSNALSIEKFERLVIQFRNRPIYLL